MKLQQSEIQELTYKFLEICAIDNPTWQEDKMVDWILWEVLHSREVPIVDEWKNIHYFIEGEWDPVFVNAHTDSVQPCENKVPHFDWKVFSSKGDTILGADDLEWIVATLYAIDYLKKNNIKHSPIDVIFTSMEEISWIGVKNFDFSDVKSKKGIILDWMSPVWTIIQSSPSKYKFALTFNWISGHAGVSTKWVSAISIMGNLIHELNQKEIVKKMRFNFGKIRGGTAVNVVPNFCEIEGEIRWTEVQCIDLIEFIKEKINEVEKNYEKCSIDFEYESKRKSYKFKEDNEFILEIWKAISENNLTPKLIHSFWLSDWNTFNQLGLKTVVIWIGCKNVHTVNESLELSELVKLTEVVIDFLKK